MMNDFEPLIPGFSWTPILILIAVFCATGYGCHHEQTATTRKCLEICDGSAIIRSAGCSVGECLCIRSGTAPTDSQDSDVFTAPQ